MCFKITDAQKARPEEADKQKEDIKNTGAAYNHPIIIKDVQEM